MSIARLVLVALLVAAAPARAADVVVSIERDGNAMLVKADARFEGTAAIVWQVLTDYDHLAEFVPDLAVSRVLSRNGNQAEVEQRGEARLLFLSLPIHARLAVTEHPYERIVTRAVAGSFREMQATFSLEAEPGRVWLHYSARFVPDFFVPPLIGPLVMKRNAEATFRALVDEIERRRALAAKP